MEGRLADRSLVLSDKRLRFGEMLLHGYATLQGGRAIQLVESIVINIGWFNLFGHAAVDATVYRLHHMTNHVWLHLFSFLFMVLFMFFLMMLQRYRFFCKSQLYALRKE